MLAGYDLWFPLDVYISIIDIIQMLKTSLYLLLIFGLVWSFVSHLFSRSVKFLLKIVIYIGKHKTILGEFLINDEYDDGIQPPVARNTEVILHLFIYSPWYSIKL